MILTRKHVSRRSLLRGMGAALASAHAGCHGPGAWALPPKSDA